MATTTSATVSQRSVRKISRNGQVSIPADARNRWSTDHVITVDMGDYVIVRPLPDDPVNELMGKYASPGLDSEKARRSARMDDASVWERKRR